MDVEIKDNFYTGSREVDTGIYREGNMEESFVGHYENGQYLEEFSGLME